MIHAIDRRRFIAAFAITTVLLMTAFGLFGIGQMSRDKVNPTREPAFSPELPEWVMDGRAVRCASGLLHDFFPLTAAAADTYILLCTALADEF